MKEWFPTCPFTGAAEVQQREPVALPGLVVDKLPAAAVTPQNPAGVLELVEISDPNVRLLHASQGDLEGVVE